MVIDWTCWAYTRHNVVMYTIQITRIIGKYFDFYLEKFVIIHGIACMGYCCGAVLSIDWLKIQWMWPRLIKILKCNATVYLYRCTVLWSSVINLHKWRNIGVSVSLCLFLSRTLNQFSITVLFPCSSQVMSILAICKYIKYAAHINTHTCVESGLVTIFDAWFHIGAPK